MSLEQRCKVELLLTRQTLGLISERATTKNLIVVPKTPHRSEARKIRHISGKTLKTTTQLAVAEGRLSVVYTQLLRNNWDTCSVHLRKMTQWVSGMASTAMQSLLYASANDCIMQTPSEHCDLPVHHPEQALRKCADHEACLRTNLCTVQPETAADHYVNALISTAWATTSPFVISANSIRRHGKEK